MKLLYVVHQFFPECHSGTEQYCLALAREARRQGDEVTILTLDGVAEHRGEQTIRVEDRPYDDFSVIRMRLWAGLQPDANLRDYENPKAAARFGEILRDLSPDALHYFHLRNLGSDFLTTGKSLGFCSVVHLMDFWYLCPRFTLLTSSGELCDGPPDEGRGCIPCHAPGVDDPGPLLRRKRVQLERLAQADAIFAPSRFLVEVLANNGFTHANLQVLPYGLEPGRVSRSPVQRPRSPLRIGFAGVFSPWKGAHVLIDAVTMVEGPLELRLYGRFEEPMFQDYIDGLRKQASQDPRITFCGAYDSTQLDQVMAELDLLVVPSLWYENTPLVILEAFTAGLPVLASALGGITEIVREGIDGYTCPAGDSSALARRLRRILDRPEELASLRPQAVDSIADNYRIIRASYA